MASADRLISACRNQSRTLSKPVQRLTTYQCKSGEGHDADAVSMQDAAIAAGKQRAINKLLHEHRLGRCSPVTSFSKQCSACGNQFWYNCQTCNMLAVITLHACQQKWLVA